MTVLFSCLHNTDDNLSIASDIMHVFKNQIRDNKDKVINDVKIKNDFHIIRCYCFYI